MNKVIRFLGLLGLITLFYSTGFAQNILGTVTDSLGKAVPFANISLKNSSDNLVIAYTVSNDKGIYQLGIPAGAVINGLLIEVSSMGFNKQSKTISELSSPINFILSPAVSMLKTVTIKGGPWLRTHGDTLSYKVADFAGLQDRVIGDVIKKMPGISVADDGKISYNGKAISNLYIGGDNLLDDKYNIATNTIPHGVVSDVQVIENDQSVKMLQNKIVSDDVSLNLTIKKDAKLQLVGQESIGAGLPGNYDVDLNAMMFKDKYKAINYLQGNNTGFDVQNNLVSHNSAEYLQRIDNDKPTSLLSLGTVNHPDIARSRYLFDQSGTINLNNLVNIKRGEQLRVNLYYLHDTQRQDFNQQTQIFLPNDTVKYTETQRNKFRPDILHAQFTLNVNKDNYYLNNSLIIDDSRRSSFSALNVNGTAVNQTLKDNSLDFSNEFDMLQPIKASTHIFEFYSYVNHISEPENRIIEPGYNAALFNNGNPYSQLAQTVNVPTWFTNNYLSYKIPADYITQSYKAGFLIQSQQLNSDLNVIRLNGGISIPDSAINRLNWLRKKLYAEAAYDLPGTIWKIKLTLPVNLQQIHYTDYLFASDKTRSGLYFSPQLKVKYQVGIEDYFNFLYNYHNNIGDIQAIYPGRILTDYRTLYANNADLTESKVQRAALGFNYRKAITLFFFSINTSYSHTSANSIASSTITNTMQQRIALPFQNSTDTWSVSGYISKYSFDLLTTFSAGIDWQSNSTNQIQNNILLPYQTISEIFNTGAETKLSNRLTVSYKANLSLINSHSSAATSSYNVKQLIQQATVNYNPIANLYFKLSGEDYLTRQQQVNDLKYFFADASMKYHINKIKTDLELDAYNFLNVKNYSTLNLSANTFTSGSFALPGRIVLMKLMFNI